MIKAEIVAHSLSPQGDELISVLCTFPRIILAEVNTHRMLSKNTSSSRAIPFNKMVEAVQSNPFIPIAWQKDHKGMQGTEYITDKNQIKSKNSCWLQARDNAIRNAKFLNSNLVVHEVYGEDFISFNQVNEDSLESLTAKERLEATGVTKQLCNRLLEPFMWTTMLITGPRSGWENFFKLRCPQYTFDNATFFKSKKEACLHIYNGKLEPNNKEDIINDLDWFKINKGQAEIHIMDLAEKIWDALNESKPKALTAGQWHIPFEKSFNDEKLKDIFHPSNNSITDNIIRNSKDFGRTTQRIDEVKVKVSVAMAARTSYTIVGDEKEIQYDKMIGLHDRLLSQDPPHSSPLEHCARAMSNEEYYSHYKGIVYNPTWIEKLYLIKEAMGWCNNFKGFIQYRYLIDNGIAI